MSAGLILAFTGGQGTDTVVRNVVHEKVVPSYENTGDSGSGNEQTPVQKPKSDSTDSNDETTTDGSTGDGSSSGTGSSGTDGSTSTGTSGSTDGTAGSTGGASSN